MMSIEDKNNGSQSATNKNSSKIERYKRNFQNVINNGMINKLSKGKIKKCPFDFQSDRKHENTSMYKKLYSVRHKTRYNKLQPTSRTVIDSLK